MPKGTEAGHEGSPILFSPQGTPWLTELPSATLFELLCASGCVRGMAVDCELRVSLIGGLGMNPIISNQDIIGKCLDEFLVEPWLGERRRLLQARFVAPGQPHLVFDMVEGQEVWALHLAVGSGDDAGILIVATAPEMHVNPPANFECSRLRHVTSPGPLLHLSVAELEVLWLMSKGLGRDEIANQLHRTVKAIERRRTTLGRKLGVTRSQHLTVIGAKAGLHRMTHLEITEFGRHNCRGQPTLRVQAIAAGLIQSEDD